MRRARTPRDERDPLYVPMIPGALPAARHDVPPAPSRRPRFALVLGVVVLLGLIFFGGVLLSRGPSGTQETPAASTPTPAPVRPHSSTKPTAQQRAHAAAVRLAGRLPVALESAGLLRIGKNLYVVGGKPRAGGKPTDAVLQIVLASGHVRGAGRFIEPLADAGTARRGGDLYLAGGWTGSKVATAVLRWSPGKAVTVVARLPVGLRRASAAFVGSRLYVAGGSPQRVFSVDVSSGKVAPAGRLPRELQQQGSNLDYLTQAQLR